MEGFMTASEFAIEMQKIRERRDGDPERMHCEMDDLMIRVLRQHGYDAGCDVFMNSDKWYW